MSFSPPRIRVFLSSPGDVAEERVLATKLVRRLADEFAGRACIEPVIWEHEPLLAHDTFQTQIPRASECEVAACILWTRVGTRLPAKITRSDGSTYASGTEYEFEDAVEGRKRNGHPDLLVYRKTAEPTVSLKDEAVVLERLAQRKALDGFIRKWFHDEADGTLKAAFHAFAAPSDFEQLFEAHLRKLIERRLPKVEVASGGAGAPPAPKASWTAGSPFRGLEAFEFEHAPVFFGRTRGTADVIAAFRRQAAEGRPFVLVTGVSGGGKSSLARAGVLPLLTQPGVIEGVGLWRRAVSRPANSAGEAFAALASALLKPEGLPELCADGTTPADLARLLRHSPAAAAGLVQGALSQAAAATAREHSLPCQPVARLALLVDQLEELFTLPALPADARSAYVAALDALARGGRVFVLATVRGDFYPRCFHLPALVALTEGAGQYVLAPPAPVEIGQAIRGPARAAGLTFEEDGQTRQPLDEALHQAASISPESLPLLEFALDELYQRRTPGNVLTWAAYRDLGGVEGALSRRAEAVFAGRPLYVRQALPGVLRALVSVGEGGAATRRRAPMASAAPTPQAAELVEAFVGARLFVADRGDTASDAGAPLADPAAGAVVAVAHEALLRNWPRLVEWLEGDRDLLRVRERVSAAADHWVAESRRGDLLLSDGRPLAEAVTLAEAWGEDLSPRDRQFVQASAARAARRRKVRRGAVVGLAVLTALAAGSAFYANRQRGLAAANAAVAKASATRADDQAFLLRRRLSENYAAEGMKLAEAGPAADTSIALLWFVRSLELTSGDPGAERNARTRFATSLLNVARPLDSPELDDLIAEYMAAETKSNGRELRFAKDHELKPFEVEIVDEATGKPLTPPLMHANLVMYASFSRDGAKVATASSDYTARVWDAATGKPLTPPLMHEQTVLSAFFSPDGMKVATISGDKTARVWDTATGKPLTPPIRHEGHLSSAAFSPDATKVVTFSDDCTARVWDAATGKPLTSPLVHEHVAYAASFSPDGTKVVTECESSGARVWEAKIGQPKTPPLTHAAAVTSVSFSPDGAKVVTGSEDCTARVWDAGTGQPLTPPLKHEFSVSAASFSPDGTKVVTASEDCTARIWDAKTGQPLTPPLKHEFSVRSPSFSPDGTKVVTASEQTARVWDAATGEPLTPALVHADFVHEARFSPNGTKVATLSGHEPARFWDVESGKPLTAPLTHDFQVSSGSFSPDATKVVTVGRRDNNTQVWDAMTCKPLTPPLEHMGQDISASFSSDGSKVATFNYDHTARVWDAATGQPLTPLLVHAGAVWDVKFSPDGTKVVTAGEDGTARVWDAVTGRPLSPPLRHAGSVKSVKFSPDGTMVVTASKDGTARVWDVRHDVRPATDLRELAELLSCHRLDAADGLQWLTGDEWRERWERMRKKYPEEFRRRPNTTPATTPATHP